jgi:hypothetical protein
MDRIGVQTLPHPKGELTFCMVVYYRKGLELYEIMEGPITSTGGGGIHKRDNSTTCFVVGLYPLEIY